MLHFGIINLAFTKKWHSPFCLQTLALLSLLNTPLHSFLHGQYMCCCCCCCCCFSSSPSSSSFCKASLRVVILESVLWKKKKMLLSELSRAAPVLAQKRKRHSILVEACSRVREAGNGIWERKRGGPARRAGSRAPLLSPSPELRAVVQGCLAGQGKKPGEAQVASMRPRLWKMHATGQQNKHECAPGCPYSRPAQRLGHQALASIWIMARREAGPGRLRSGGKW